MSSDDSPRFMKSTGRSVTASRGGARLFLSGRSGLDYNDSKTAWRRPPVGRHAFNCWE